MTDLEAIRLIEDAWRETPYPGDNRIVPPASHDFDGIEDYFRGTSWHGHSPVNLRCHSAAFSYFTPHAFHYWLPAFMIAAIQNPAEADVICKYIPRSLNNSYSLERLSLFSPEQKRSVVAYLRFQIEKFPDLTLDERTALAILEQAA